MLFTSVRVWTIQNCLTSTVLSPTGTIQWSFGVLEERLKVSKTVAGTQKLHCIVPVGENTVEVRQFSDSPQSTLKE